MSTMIRSARLQNLVIAFALVMVASACNDNGPTEPGPTGVCRAEGACEVAGVDLVVEPLRIVAAQVDSVTGLPLLFPGDTLRLHYRVRNRGDRSSAATALHLCAICNHPDFQDSVRAVPTLEPGAVDSGAVAYVLPGAHYRDTLNIRASLDWRTLEDDPLYLNDMSESRVYFAVPMPEITVEVPGGELRVAEPKTIRLTIENRSRYAALEGRTLHYCFGHYDIASCGFGFTSLRDIPPSGVLDTMVTIAVPHDAWEPGLTEAYDLYLAACVGAVHDFWDCGGGDDWTTLLPNLDDYCSAPLIPTDTTVTGLVDDSDCDLAWNIGVSDVWSMDAAAATPLEATLTSSPSGDWKIQVRSWRGDLLGEATSVAGAATVRFTAGNDTRYHVIVTGTGEYALQVTAPDSDRRTGHSR